MSLIVRVSINDVETVALLSAQRMEGSADPDSINLYQVNAWAKSLDDYGVFAQTVTAAEVNHRYGSGAMMLVWRMISETPEGKDRLERTREDGHWTALHRLTETIKAREDWAEDAAAQEILKIAEEMRWSVPS